LTEDEQKKLQKAIYWGRAAIGIGLGALLAAFWRPNMGGLFTVASISIFSYLATFLVLSNLLGKHRVESLGGKNKLYTIGIGVFFLSVVFTWILLYSLFFHTW